MFIIKLGDIISIICLRVGLIIIFILWILYKIQDRKNKKQNTHKI